MISEAFICGPFNHNRASWPYVWAFRHVNGCDGTRLVCQMFCTAENAEAKSFI